MDTKLTVQIFEQFYGKPFVEITQADIGNAEELDWARTLEVRYLYKDYAPQCISIDDMVAETRRKTWIEIINRLMKSI